MSTDINNFHFVKGFTKNIFKMFKREWSKNILKLLINTKIFFKLSFCKLIMKNIIAITTSRSDFGIFEENFK